MHILVTGGAGFIGSHVLEQLNTKDDVQVVVYDNLSSGSASHVPEGMELVEHTDSDDPVAQLAQSVQPGKLGIDDEVRLVLDAAPHLVIPARISFVADVAQFTPKTVETASERQKLMFRVKARIAPDLLKQHVARVKTGLPGMAYVRLDAKAEWPAGLRVRLPKESGDGSP